MHSKSKIEVLKTFGTNEQAGLTEKEIFENRKKYGANVIDKAKQKNVIMRVLGALSEPMMIILCFALAITFGVNIGKYLKTGDGDFIECVGIFCAVVISSAITVVMEGRSEKAFELLSKMNDNILVKVRRSGEIKLIPQSEVVVGDVVLIESGNKIVADGRLLKANSLSVDESMLTGESKPRNKKSDVTVSEKSSISERVNMVYGGTLVVGGSGEMLVTAVGAHAEFGRIAGELQKRNKISSPLNEKLSRLGKVVTAIGGISAVIVFAISLTRLIVLGKADFASVQEIFIESVVLIVAAVPEGLPTIVAISLSINVMKLAKENAIIKKLVATETVGCVSVICSDKTGTLTCGKMKVEKICSGDSRFGFNAIDVIKENILINSTADFVYDNGKGEFKGNPTECALLDYIYGKNGAEVEGKRQKYCVLDREEFSSENKYMSTKTRKNGDICIFYKGAIEKIFDICSLEKKDRERTNKSVREYAKDAKRVIAFAHTESGQPKFDGFAVISDPIRRDVKEAVASCKSAGIKVKVLTGDNLETAFAIARELQIASCGSEVANGVDIEKLNDAQLSARLQKVSVIARCTPLLKLRVVKALMNSGEVVAVTGDGINDAPAIKQADIGIAMGSGSEIAKEAGDIVLLDDSFSTIVKAISFGRNVFNNFKRFIMFQLSVNFSAVLTVLAFLFVGLKSPFNALQLLWLNIIMDGPPALTLGFEAPSQRLMIEKPKLRTDNLVDRKTLMRIIVHSVYMSAVILCQATFNFLGAMPLEQSGVIFTLFVFMQLFNAFNCKQIGKESIFKNFFSNRSMLLAFGIVSVMQVLITQFGGSVFETYPLSFSMWVKIIAISSTILLVSEVSKLVYRIYQGLFAKKTVNKGVLARG